MIVAYNCLETYPSFSLLVCCFRIYLTENRGLCPTFYSSYVALEVVTQGVLFTSLAKYIRVRMDYEIGSFH